MKFELKRPIVFFDIESTGLDTSNDRIVELCMIKLSRSPVKGEDYHREVRTRRFDPIIPISPQATDVHGITNEDVKDCLPFHKYAKGILSFIEGCDLAGFNSNRFDIPMLAAEFERSYIDWDWKSHNFIDVGNMYKINNPRTLSAAYEKYTGTQLGDAHAAEVDVNATIEVFKGLLNEGLKDMDQLEITPEQLAKFSNFDKEMVDLNCLFIKDDNGDIIINFSKKKGEKAKDNLSFLQWMVDRDFPSSSKEVCYSFLYPQ